MNKKIKNLVVATFVFLGASYVLETYINNKKRQQEIERAKLLDKDNNEVKGETKYILLKEFYKDKENIEQVNTGKRR